MISFNTVILAGYLTRDLEMRYTQSGQAVGKSGLGVNRKWRNERGEEMQETMFIDIVAWSGTAETMAKYLGKGSPVLLEGALKLEQWDDKQTGQKRSKIVVNVARITFLGEGKVDGKGDGAEPEPAPPAKRDTKPAKPQTKPVKPATKEAEAQPDPAYEETDVPF